MKIRLSGIPEASQGVHRLEHDQNEVRNILQHLGEYSDVNIENVFRLGKVGTTRNRPRMVIERFRNPYLASICFAKGYKLRDYGGNVFIYKSLSPDEIELEKKLLKRRYELIQSGIDKSALKIRNLKVYENGNLVQVS